MPKTTQPKVKSKKPARSQYGAHDVKEMPVKKSKKRKPKRNKIFEELWDIVEDIFD
ncbi:hypothetical protein [Aestuariibius sp. HNIBRBA575]|uniref:hypothetical protein n=1 Tax=Aestuariibius sp. HNIBRBA575 TaxID=3233343 RepID=UPI0034A53CB1